MILVLFANVLSFSRVTFICGRAGVCALGAVIAKHAGDERLLDYYLKQFKEVFCCIYLFMNHDLMIVQFTHEFRVFNFFFVLVLLFLEQIELPRDLPYELLYGRTGYLWACSFLNKHVGKDTIPTTYMVRHMFFIVAFFFAI